MKERTKAHEIGLLIYSGGLFGLLIAFAISNGVLGIMSFVAIAIGGVITMTEQEKLRGKL